MADPVDWDAVAAALAELPGRLVAERAARGASLRTAAAQAGVSVPVLQRVERGLLGSRVPGLVALARWVDTPPEPESDPPQEPEPVGWLPSGHPDFGLRVLAVLPDSGLARRMVKAVHDGLLPDGRVRVRIRGTGVVLALPARMVPTHAREGDHVVLEVVAAPYPEKTPPQVDQNQPAG